MSDILKVESARGHVYLACRDCQGLAEAVSGFEAVVRADERERYAALEASAKKADELLAGMWSYDEVGRANLAHTWYVQASEVLRAALASLTNEAKV